MNRLDDGVSKSSNAGPLSKMHCSHDIRSDLLGRRDSFEFPEDHVHHILHSLQKAYMLFGVIPALVLRIIKLA